MYIYITFVIIIFFFFLFGVFVKFIINNIIKQFKVFYLVCQYELPSLKSCIIHLNISNMDILRYYKFLLLI